ncbi:MAG: hypothetical protein QXL94_00280 [Candidatus Parvarchaeum sp.]
MVRKLTTDEANNFDNEISQLVEVNTFSSLVKKAWEAAMKQPAEDTPVELSAGETLTLQQLLDNYDSGNYTAEMKETLGQIVNIPKISQKLNRFTHGQFAAAVGKKLNSSLGQLKAEHEKRLKEQRALLESDKNSKISPASLPNIKYSPSAASELEPKEVPIINSNEVKNESEEIGNKGISLARIHRYKRTGGLSFPESE